MNKMRPVHPGEILREEIATLKLSANKFAEKLHVPTNRITAILNGQRGITADTALRLSVFFGTSAEFWLRLQNAYDLKLAEMKSGKRIKKEVLRKSAAKLKKASLRVRKESMDINKKFDRIEHNHSFS